MRFSEMKNRAENGHFIEDNVIPQIMQSLLDMPLTKMYSDNINSCHNKNIYALNMLEEYSNKIRADVYYGMTFGEYIDLCMKDSAESPPADAYICSLPSLSVWPNGFVPGFIARK